ncbi:hypothetical protein Fuma_00902 [Fuerstiella marisgermanici]|uniref:Uncharacterized protein n=1 Tax=Fuerstiella marisgermanici TaxID=1891926 RepID=A0A1P8WB71_9PLAN|nr:hypothetical protein Fuma_00902 [Fuerstiella marisgermanici]
MTAIAGRDRYTATKMRTAFCEAFEAGGKDGCWCEISGYRDLIRPLEQVYTTRITPPGSFTPPTGGLTPPNFSKLAVT